jgi:glycosyltransferase involved in cell wall biosynthesis
VAEKPIQVFVHLARGFGGASWNQQWKNGKILGINEPYPYGYHRAESMGCSVFYSEDFPESAAERFFRLGIRAVLGFDLIHAYRNLERMRRADVIWTHTESQFLAIILLFRLKPGTRRPKLIAQSVWLFDHWSGFSALKRWYLSKLIRRADILTFHSPRNLSVARRLFPDVRSELVLFGISADTKITPALRPPGGALNLVSLGNDPHRDWKLLIDAVRGQRDWSLKIASRKVKPSAIAGSTNVDILKIENNDELLALYRSADLLVLAIKPNLHASGITVIQEAALQGIPVICSDDEGLRAYFSDTEVCFVPPQDGIVLCSAIRALADDAEVRIALAQKAQDRMGPSGLSSEAFVRRHVEISRDMLSLTKEP